MGFPRHLAQGPHQTSENITYYNQLAISHPHACLSTTYISPIRPPRITEDEQREAYALLEQFVSFSMECTTELDLHASRPHHTPRAECQNLISD